MTEPAKDLSKDPVETAKVIPFVPKEYPNPNDPHAGIPNSQFPRGGKPNETMTDHIKRLHSEIAALQAELAIAKKGPGPTKVEPVKVDPPKPAATIGTTGIGQPTKPN
jgi:hypothetical protein